MAIKIISLNDCASFDEEDFASEVLLMGRLRNPNIVALYGVCYTSSDRRLIVELVEGGSLDKRINELRNGKKSCNLGKKIRMLIDIISGVSYLHSFNPKIIHRDLKPGNVLIGNNDQAKICDFGMSKLVSQTNKSNTARVGTISYMAPEMIAPSTGIKYRRPVSGRQSIFKNHNRYEIMDEQQTSFNSSAQYDTSVDIYSFGIIMWELFFEESPYSYINKVKLGLDKGPSIYDKLENQFMVAQHVSIDGLRPHIPFETKEECYSWIERYMREGKSTEHLFNIVFKYIELMTRCWSQKPEERPSSLEVLQSLTELQKEYTKG